MRTLLSLAAIITLFGLNAFANAGGGGVDAHGGGGGVVIGEKVYLLDLFEAGLQTDADVWTPKPDAAFVQTLLNSRLPSGVPTELLARKIGDLESVDSVLAAAVVGAIEAHSWRFYSEELPLTDDFGKLPAGLRVEQLAVRRGSSVLIQSSLWSRLDDVNRVALVIHEALSSLQAVASLSNQAPLRRVVSELFDRQFAKRPFKEIEQTLSGLPSLYEASRLLGRERPSLPFQAQYTRTTFKDFGGVYVPSVLNPVMGSKFFFSPFISLNWSSDSGAPSEMQNPFVSADIFDGLFTRYCTTQKKSAQLYGAVVNYFEMKVGRTTYTEGGNTYPRLNWALEPKTYLAIAFNRQPSSTKANCSNTNRTEMRFIDGWGRFLLGEQLLLPE